MRRTWSGRVTCVAALLTWQLAASAAGAGTDRVSVKPTSVRAGRPATLHISGRDSAPPRALGADIDVLLEPPLNHGGRRCGHDLGLTEQNHPGYIELARERPVDPRHTGKFKLALRTPPLRLGGGWIICAWEYDNEGVSSTSSPASHTTASLKVNSRRG